MAFIKTGDGVQIFYKDWGSGRPVVFIHGWPVNADMWEYQMVPLAKQGLRTIAYDRRGFGRSSQSVSPYGSTPYSYDLLADDLAALLDGLDLRDVTLVGFSMGGGEVARYLSRYGTSRVSKVVLVSAVTPFLLKRDDNPDGVERSVFDGMIEKLTLDRPHFLAGFGKSFYGASLLHSPVSPEFLQWTGNLALQASPLATLDCVRLFSETDFRSDLAAFTVPTLVIHGTSDSTVPIDASSRRTAAAIPGARLVEYDGAPHGLFYTHKDRLTVDLHDFVTGATPVG